MRALDLPPEIADDPRLADLATLVAEVRPVAGAERSASIDARAARAFAAPRERRPIAIRLWAPAFGVAACALLALVIGLGTRGGSPATLDERTSSGAGISTADAPAGVSRAAPAAPAVAASGAADAAATRKVERSAALTLGVRARDIDAAASGAARVATTLGGYVAASSTSSGSGGSLELRVPAARLDDAVARLSRLGHVRALERSTLDITASAVSARGLLADAVAERRSLLRQLAHAGTPGETERIRARLRLVSRQIQAARAGVRRVNARAAFATLSVNVVPERRGLETGGGWTPRDALHDALRVLEMAAGIALVALAVALPLALLGTPAWLAVRRAGRRRRERALDAA